MIFNVFFTVLISLFYLYFNKRINYEHKYPKIFIVINTLLSFIFISKIKGNWFLMILFITLVNITLIDISYMKIPDIYNAMVFVLGIINVLISKKYLLIIVGLTSFALFFAIALFSKGALGGGDIKLALGLGFFFKPSLYINFLAYTFGIGALVAIMLLISKRKDKEDKIPFGPFMSLGAILTILL